MGRCRDRHRHQLYRIGTNVLRNPQGVESLQYPPPNSPQKLARPGFGPPAEPARYSQNRAASRGAHSRASNAGAPRAAAASARGPWPCSLASDPLGGHRSLRQHVPPPHSYEWRICRRLLAGVAFRRLRVARTSTRFVSWTDDLSIPGRTMVMCRERRQCGRRSLAFGGVHTLAESISNSRASR